jgi:hypothetical protein
MIPDRIRIPPDGEHLVATWEAVARFEPDGNDSTFRFGDRAVGLRWPCLWTLGDRAILGHPLLGLFCSSRCPGDIILQTYDLARALRDAGVPVIGGFHSPMEKECLALHLRGTQPVVVCPARSIQGMRVPVAWRMPVTEGRLLLLSPFPPWARRPTAAVAEQRNHLVAEVARVSFVPYAAPNSKTDALCRKLLAEGKPVWTFDTAAAAPLRAAGARCFPTAREVVQSLTSARGEG